MLTILKRIGGLLDRRAWRGVSLLLGLTLITSMLEAVGVGMVFPFIKVVSDPGWAAQTPWLKPLAGLLDGTDRTRVVRVFGIGLVTLFVLKNVYMVAFYWVQFSIAHGNAARYSTALLERYMEAPYLTHLRRNSAEFIKNVGETPLDLFNSVLAAVGILTEMLVALAILAVLLLSEPVATMIAVAVLVGTSGLYLLFTGPLVQAWGRERLRLSTETQQALAQAFGGVKEAKVLGRTTWFIAVFDRLRTDIFHVYRRLQTMAQAPRLVIETAMMSGLIVVVVILVGSDDSGTGNADVMARLGLFAAAAFRLLPSINRLNQNVHDLRASAAGVERLANELSDGPALTAFSAVPVERLGIRRELRFEDIGFSYGGPDRPALSGIDLRVAAGETIGLVGSSGSGKSTLVDIVLGLLTPTSGRLLIDGRPVGGGEGAPRLGGVGYVPQFIYITDDTVRRNVAFGIPDGEIDDDAVRRALKRARLSDFIDGLPDGLDTRLDENGTRLSGGQRQRIGIARALYHDPDLLVFDEATSALDPLTERDITEAIRSLHGHKTVIIIAHRLSTVRHCDRILMLDHGRIAQSGRFDELAERSPAFRALMEALEMALHPQNEGNTEQS